jgi:hypothetical protein
VSIDPDFLAPQPSFAVLLMQNSAKSEWSSPAAISSVIGSVAFGVFHSGEVSLGDKNDSQMDVVPPLDVVHRLQFAKKPQVFSIIVLSDKF